MIKFVLTKNITDNGEKWTYQVIRDGTIIGELEYIGYWVFSQYFSAQLSASELDKISKFMKSIETYEV